MMNAKKLFMAATVAAFPSTGYAGGFDLTGQPIELIFEEGTYIEGNIGLLTADVDGTNPVGGRFGDTADDFPFFSGGVKTDFTDRISGALLFDTPFKRETTYSAGLFNGTAATVEANTFTLVGRYKFSDYFSVYGGPRLQFSGIDLQGPFARNPVTGALTNFPTYQVNVEDEGFGFVAGLAAEIPKYRARASFTYNSAIKHDFDSAETFATAGGPLVIPGSVEVETPQSVNIDLQGPVTETTLVKASIRWADWGGVNFTPPGFLQLQGRPVVEYTEDTITYRLTVAQKINDNYAAFVTGSYEADGGEEISLFKTVDGGISAGGGFVYQNEDGFKLQLAGEYRWLNGTSGSQVPGAPSSDFDEATAFGLSMKVGYRF